MIDGGNGIYRIFEGGEIIFIKDIQFRNRYADHASLNGRPCIILSDYDDKLTMLPLTSSISSNHGFYTEKFLPSDFKYQTRSFRIKNDEYANMLSMFQKDLRYYDVVSQLSLARYYKLLISMEEKRLEKIEPCNEIYRSIYQDLEYQKEQIQRKLVRKN